MLATAVTLHPRNRFTRVLYADGDDHKNAEKSHSLIATKLGFLRPKDTVVPSAQRILTVGGGNIILKWPCVFRPHEAVLSHDRLFAGQSGPTPVMGGPLSWMSL